MICLKMSILVFGENFKSFRYYFSELKRKIKIIFFCKSAFRKFPRFCTIFVSFLKLSRKQLTKNTKYITLPEKLLLVLMIKDSICLKSCTQTKIKTETFIFCLFIINRSSKQGIKRSMKETYYIPSISLCRREFGGITKCYQVSFIAQQQLGKKEYI